MRIAYIFLCAFFLQSALKAATRIYVLHQEKIDVELIITNGQYALAVLPMSGDARSRELISRGSVRRYPHCINLIDENSGCELVLKKANRNNLIAITIFPFLKGKRFELVPKRFWYEFDKPTATVTPKPSASFADTTPIIRGYLSTLEKMRKQRSGDIQGLYSPYFPPLKGASRLEIDSEGYTLFLFDVIVLRGKWDYRGDELYLADDELNCNFIFRRQGDVLSPVNLMGIKWNFFRVD